MEASNYSFLAYDAIRKGCIERSLDTVLDRGCVERIVILKGMYDPSPWLTLPPRVQGATVLQRLARLYEMAIQGATKGATKCNPRCYIFKIVLGIFLGFGVWILVFVSPFPPPL
jgi:hypothetical protein